MAEPGDTGSTELMYHCPNCGHDFALDEHKDEEPCPVCTFVCDKQRCLTHYASKEDY
ncbi:MAG TPA: hypothetical protein PLZ36_09230 [Armatimonadota bacterium]|nr:hypothetical protein [Armatimonadota bacterium]HOS42679.1 hypothetical protein [Armatimonadota bacterium]